MRAKRRMLVALGIRLSNTGRRRTQQETWLVLRMGQRESAQIVLAVERHDVEGIELHFVVMLARVQPQACTGQEVVAPS